jgi:hypothetical protein
MPYAFDPCTTVTCSRRSGGVVNTKGAGERRVEGPPRTGRSHVVNPDAGTVAAAR